MGARLSAPLYINDYFANMDPQRLAFAVLQAGKKPPPTDNYTYCDLGMGRGMTLCMLAAANPDCDFWGCDYDAASISDAVAMTRDMGLQNTHIYDDDFARFATRDLPQFDYIGLHGVISWVSLDVRDQIAGFLQTFLKPGGIVQVSYNALPAWSGLQALRQMMIAHMGDRSQDPVRAQKAIDFAAMLAKSRPPGLGIAPAADVIVETLLTGDPAYLIHEHLGEVQSPFHAHDVDQWLSPLGLEYVASAGLEDPQKDGLVALHLLALANAPPDPAYRRTMMDMVAGRLFRRDIFVRAPERLTRDHRMDALAGVKVGLLRTKEDIADKSDGMPTEIKAHIAAIAGALADGPLPVSDVVAANGKPAELALGYLLGLNHATLVPGRVPGQHVSAANAVLLDRAHNLQGRAALVSTEARAGIRLPWQDLMFLLAEKQGDDPVNFTLSTMRSQRGNLKKTLAEILDADDPKAIVADQFRIFYLRTRPTLKNFGVEV